MTPLFCWVFLLALVGRAASLPTPLVNDACALVCNPGAETEGERERRERDPAQYPRYPKGVCKLQSSSDQDQAKVLVSYCFKLCAKDLSDASELNCFVLRSSIESELGCYCPALVPLSPNTMRLHENWRITHLVNELAKDVVSSIFNSPIEQNVICELHKEVFPSTVQTGGIMGQKCREEKETTPKSDGTRVKRDADEGIFMQRLKDAISDSDQMENTPEMDNMEHTSEHVMESAAPYSMDQEEDILKPMAYEDQMEPARFCEITCLQGSGHESCDCEEIRRRFAKQEEAKKKKLYK